MRIKTLGRTRLEVPIVGLGTAFLGMATIKSTHASYEELVENIDEDLGVRTVHAALEAGSTLVDTAALYGGGRSEEIIGRALRARPDLAARCTVTTKVGRTASGYDYSHDAVWRSVETSLQRLGLDRLAVVYVHDAMGAPMEAVMGRGGALSALRRLQDEGIVGFVGTAADYPETNAAYIETGEFDAAVVPRAWSLINQLAVRRILPAAEKHNVGLVIATSLERGLLAIGPQPGNIYYDRDYSPACQDHVRQVQLLCREYNVPMVAAALQWVTRHPQVATTIPGARFPQEAEENARAAEAEISESFWQALEPLLRHWPDAVGVNG